jgi:hypothetical protein
MVRRRGVKLDADDTTPLDEQGNWDTCWVMDCLLTPEQEEIIKEFELEASENEVLYKVSPVKTRIWSEH